MKSEELVIVSATSAALGAAMHQAGLSTGNRWLDVGLGVVVTAAGYLSNYDGLSDAVEGFGVGIVLDSIL